LPKEYRSPFGAFRLDVRASEGRVTITQELELKAQRVSPADYPAFREFCATVDAWEGEPIILQKKTVNPIRR